MNAQKPAKNVAVKRRWCWTVNYIASERRKERDVFGTQPDLLRELKSIEHRHHDITSVRRIFALH